MLSAVARQLPNLTQRFMSLNPFLPRNLLFYQWTVLLLVQPVGTPNTRSVRLTQTIILSTNAATMRRTTALPLTLIFGAICPNKTISNWNPNSLLPASTILNQKVMDKNITNLKRTLFMYFQRNNLTRESKKLRICLKLALDLTGSD
jgi:hypothetical protein